MTALNRGARPSAASRVELRELVLPNDANTLGHMLGGRVMHHIDLAGFLAANRHCRQRCVTAAVEHLDFLNPIRVGEAIVLEAQVIYAGRTSMDVRVRVEAEDLLSGARRPTTTAFLTFVAVDGSGRPVPVPPLRLASAAERALARSAAVRRRARRVRRAG